MSSISPNRRFQQESSPAPLSQAIAELLDRKVGRPQCPLLSAAVRTGDDLVIRTVVHLHPAEHCPAARRAA